MNHLYILVPGLGFSFGFILILLGISQLYIYTKTKYRRARAIACFCFFASFFCFMQFVVQSRSFPQEFGLVFTLIAMGCIGFSRYFYMKAMSFFIAIPNRVLTLYYISNWTLGALSLLPLLFYLVGGPEIMFDSTVLTKKGNYFSESYSLFFGQPTFFSITLLSTFAILDIIFSIYIFNIVRKSSLDVWLMMGLISTCVAALLEDILLPFTLSSFVPLYFISDLFEALRMSYLSGKEFIIEREVLSGIAQKTTPTLAPNPEKYQNSNLTDERIKILGEKLKGIMDDETIYTNANLKVEKIANIMGIPSYQLSQVINTGLKTNFNDLVNSYRIQAIMVKLQDPSVSEKTISEIAYENGYNSKSTFNTAFKKVTGVTPSQFRKEKIGSLASS